MELTFARCESIVKTLPIGFYTGRRINVTIDKDEPTSFYSPIEDKIVISYPIIAERMSHVTDDNCNEEEAVRSMLYHEVSHAILTPLELTPTTENNIFEDERIETILHNYYHDVDFRKQLYDIHGGHAPVATDYKSAFYNAVRFGLGTGRVQKKVNEILNSYSSFTRNTDNVWELFHYEEAIRELSKMIKREFEDEPDSFNEQSTANKDSNNTSENPIESDATSFSDILDNTAESHNAHVVSMSEEKVKKLIQSGLNNTPNLDPEQSQKLAEFKKAIERIISNFNKKNKNGNGINAYSGIFNPRMVTRPDYRFFDRTMPMQGNNRFGTCHLNLIIDCSGSFIDNVALTNGIIYTLTEIERKNPNFTMDVGFINTSFTLCEKIQNRILVAGGGNDVPPDMKEILQKMQRPQTCNYNIILFDGDALSDNYGNRDEKIQRFGVFDMKQTTLITDPDNKRYLNPSFSSAKVVITRNYTKELIDHIIRAMTIAFG